MDGIEALRRELDDMKTELAITKAEVERLKKQPAAPATHAGNGRELEIPLHFVRVDREKGTVDRED